MKHSLQRLFAALVLLTTVAPGAFAQGGTNSSMTGVVVDRDGGVIPGATVVVKNEATNVALTAVTAPNGTFMIPALALGNYTVTVSLQGFKTAVLKGVVVTAGGPANVQRDARSRRHRPRPSSVEGATAMVQTQASAVVDDAQLRSDHQSAGGRRATRWTSSRSCPACRRRARSATRK